jgi:hypothetical protein
MDAVDNPIPFWATSQSFGYSPQATLPILDFNTMMRKVSSRQITPLHHKLWKINFSYSFFIVIYKYNFKFFQHLASANRYKCTWKFVKKIK